MSTTPVRRKQCEKCPWKVSTDPHTIPNGYCEQKHAALRGTIAKPESFQPSGRMMACHEAPPGKEQVCAGWLGNQLGPGNNFALRMRATHDRSLYDFELDGDQHKRFEDTLPKRKRAQNA